MPKINMTDENTPSATLSIEETDAGLEVTIDTERLHLVSVTEQQTAVYQALFTDKDVLKSFGTGIPRKDEEIQQDVTTWSQRWKLNDPFSSLAVFMQESDDVIGQVVLEHGRYPGESELGYLFAPRHWGKGIATEAVTPVVEQYAHELAKRKCKVNGQPFTTLFATARENNHASNKILKKVGMTLEETKERFCHMRHHYRKTMTT